MAPRPFPKRAALRKRAALAVALVVVSTAGCANRDDSLRRLQGEWVVVSRLVDGKPAADARNDLIASFDQDRFQLIEEKTTITKGGAAKSARSIDLNVVRIDNSKRPGEIDFVVMTGDLQGQTRRGIFELVDHTLKICVGEPGAARPTDFENNAARTQLVLKRRLP